MYLWLNLSQSCQPYHADLSLTMRQELTDSFRMTMLKYDDDPLAWWKSYASDFPHVTRKGKTVLSIPAYSVPDERIFSPGGKIFHPKEPDSRQRSLNNWCSSWVTNVYVDHYFFGNMETS